MGSNVDYKAQLQEQQIANMLDSKIQMLTGYLVSIKTYPSSIHSFYKNFEGIRAWVQGVERTNSNPSHNIDKRLKKCKKLIGDIDKEFAKQMQKASSKNDRMIKSFERGLARESMINGNMDRINASMDEMLSKIDSDLGIGRNSAISDYEAEDLLANTMQRAEILGETARRR